MAEAQGRRDPPPSLSAPAKVNLGLRITGRRRDGYHELESLFVPLDLADRVELEVGPPAAGSGGSPVTLQVEGAGPEVPRGPDNLAARAAEAFLEASGASRAVRIRLTKRIPAAAGLGGGSSDAGAVLRGLARRLPRALAPGALAEVALRLGADVPYFLDPRPAWVRGIGERIEPCPGVPSLALLLVNPGAPLETRSVFEAFDALAPGAPSRAAEPGRPGLPPVRNDLEPAAVRLCPPIARLRERLRRLGAEAVGLSGSGPTVFGVFPDRGSAERALARAGFEAPIWARVAVTVQSQ